MARAPVSKTGSWGFESLLACQMIMRKIRKRRALQVGSSHSFLHSERKVMAKKKSKFLTEAYAELKKVSWPSRQEVKGATIVVLVMTFLLGFYIGLVDLFFSKVIAFLIK